MKNKGFSLIELIISMAILGIVLAALTSLFASQSRHYTAQNEILEMQGNARAAMDFVTRTMRGLKTPDITITGEGTGDSKITFSAVKTINPETTDTHRFKIYDSESDGPNTLGYASPADSRIQPLARNITKFNVQRKDKDGNNTAVNANTVRIDIKIEAETGNPLPTTGTKATITLTSSAMLRN